MAIRSTFTTGEVLTAADLTDTIKGAFINTETTTARTLGTADAGNLVTLNNNSGGTVTIPTNTTWGSPLGTLVHLINIGTAGSFTVGTAAGVTLNAASATLAIQEGGTLIKTATNTWQFVKGGGLGKARYSSTTGSPTVTTVSGKTCVQFTGSGSIAISQAGLLEILIVGAGAGGSGTSGTRGGGGGAGGYLEASAVYLAAGTHTVVTGAGAPGGAAGTGQEGSKNGGTSRVGPYYAVGGGGAESHTTTAGIVGNTGGSGGGGSGGSAGGSSTSGQGNDGGTSSGSNGGGGGGGASAVGANAVTTTGGAGGAGTASSITGSSVTRAGGGGGAGSVTGGAGGAGGGGAGGGGAVNGTAGGANTGGGGGGGTTNGGAGGSGIVILLFG